MAENLRNISTTPSGVLYREELSWGARLAMVSVAVVVGMIALIWYQLADWYVWTASTYFAALVIAATGLTALSIMLTALAGAKALRFDVERRVAFYDVEGPLYRRRREIPFRHIQRFDILMREGKNFAPSAVLLMHVLERKRPVELVELGGRDEAEQWRQALQRMVRTH